jgi:molybdopterin biosynthesis enzyme
MVITTGGASVGDYDWAVTSAEKLGSVFSSGSWISSPANP